MKVSKDYSLQTTNPALAKEWHPTKNLGLSPFDVTPGSQKKVWWRCKEGHEWQAAINNRNHGSGCFYCAGKGTRADHSLQIKHPSLASEWDSDKNIGLSFEDLTIGSIKKVWWKCKKGHVWPASPNDRGRGQGCPYCAGRRAASNNCLQTLRPDIAGEWHPTKNLGFTPFDVTPGSTKKAWWKCPKGHEWRAIIGNRTRGRGCPHCAGKIASKDNCLQSTNPRLASEWHPVKNRNLTPSDVTSLSNKKVWWRCKEGHEWQASIQNRQQGRGCRICSGRVASDKHSLLYDNPKLALEWHPKKNGNLTPDKVTPNSHAKAWWKCKRGHEWPALVSSRSKGSSCPFCFSQTSQFELRAYTELKGLFGDTQLRRKLFGYECDVFVPSLNFGFDYDGRYWHKDKFEVDKAKYSALINQNVNFIKIREKGLEKISDVDLISEKNERHFSILRKILLRVLALPNINETDRKKIVEYLSRQEFINNEEYEEIQYALPSPLLERSLAIKSADLAGEWHPTKNKSLTAYDVSLGSGRKVWWKCKSGHEWQASVLDRTQNKSGCPYCSHRRVSQETSLAVMMPLLAKEWHPANNGPLRPLDVLPFSNKKVWWRCKKGHEWMARICNRSNLGRGCPDCHKMHKAKKDKG